MRKVFLVLGIIVVLAGIYFFLIAPGAEGEVSSSSEAVVSAEEDLTITADGAEVSIPVGALPPSTEVSVREATSVETTNEMRLSGAFASPVYNIESTSESFSETVEISLEFDPALVSDGSMAIAAYWNGEMWVHVAGSVEGNTITVETDHFSLWVVLAARWAYWAYNDFTDQVYDVCVALFAPEEDKWIALSGDWDQIQDYPETYLGELPELDSIYIVSDAPLGSIMVAGSTYHIVETNLPLFEGPGNYSESAHQLGVMDSRDNLIRDPEILFKALYGYRLQEYMTGKNFDALAENLDEASSSLRRMHFWHGAISAVDITQMLLSEILAHGSTGIAPSPTELLDKDILLALEGVICRGEMERFADDTEALADELRSCDPSSMSYEELSSLACRNEAYYNRIDALTYLMQGTCPGLEDNWFMYTVWRVLEDYVGVFVQKEVAHLAHTATHSINFDDALYAAKLSVLLQMASEANQVRGLFNLTIHALKVSGENPLVEYYDDIQTTKYEFCSINHPSHETLEECAYLVEIMDSIYQNRRFTINSQGIITDSETELQWLVYTEDPGWRPTWEGFNYWVGNLGSCWRLPTISELQELHHAGINAENWGYFRIECEMIWSGEVNTQNEALNLNFSTGEIGEYPTDGVATGVRAFATRSQNLDAMQRLESSQAEDTRLPGDISQGPFDGMEFSYIPPGSFQMGGSEEEYHLVQLDYSLEILTTEVTQGMWEDVLSESIYELRDVEDPNSPLFGVGSDFPVYFVSWHDCQRFISELNAIDPNYTYRLPSEAEWEYACRAGSTTRFYWGDSISEDIADRYCWYRREGEDWRIASSVHPVGNKEPNAWGLYDMCGNAFEWCEDIVHNRPNPDGVSYGGLTYENAPADGSAWIESSRATHLNSNQRIGRGGSINHTFNWLASGFRVNEWASNRLRFMGFRIVRIKVDCLDSL